MFLQEKKRKGKRQFHSNAFLWDSIVTPNWCAVSNLALSSSVHAVLSTGLINGKSHRPTFNLASNIFL